MSRPNLDWILRSVPRLNQRLWFPPPKTAVRHGPLQGLLAWDGDLSVPRLLLAYRSGIFPWTDDPLTWWSPDPRTILELDQVHVSRSLAKIVERGRFSISVNRAFHQVVESCAAPAPGRPLTWISPQFIEAYTNLHRNGHAHSLECWLGDELAGGIYGVAIGGFFAGESMFHRVANASKVALCHLVRRLRERGFALFDVQLPTRVTLGFGAVDIPRTEYLERLARAIELPCTFV